MFHFSAPNHFTDEWLQTLNYDAEINWRLKVSNLKKILKAVIEFLNEGIEDRISIQFLPNLQEIAEHENEESTFRLLQLILACAVNCDNKQTYIQTIMGMEETVQQAIMEAIQQLMSTRLSISDTIDYEDRLCKTVEQYKALLVEKEKLAEQCKNLQEEVINLQEEKSNQQSELNRFKIYFNSLGLNPAILATTTTTTAIIPQSSPTSSIVTTTTGIESMETNLNSINSELLNQSASSSISANPCSNNVLMSPTIANLRINHLQNQLSKLRDELYRTECDKEELKIQLTEVTLQNQELKQKCTILTAKAEESIHLKDELDIAREEASNVLRLTTTIEQLRKHADEAVSLRLRCTQLENDNQICVQRLSELEQETRLGGNIRSKVKAQARLQVEDAQFLANKAIKRAELAEENLLKIRQELMIVNREKECIFSELTRLKSCCEGLQSCAQTSNYKDMSSSPAAATTTTTMLYTNLMTKLAQKEADFIEMEQKYRGYLWKAREVIRLLERQYRQHQHDCPQYKEKLMIDTHNSTDTTNSNISNDKLNEEINHLRALLVEKERVIEKLEVSNVVYCSYMGLAYLLFPPKPNQFVYEY
ncbi:hook homolog, putative [Schistosoma mansoni]|uniref:hook homolog, putative n=1 Tax=Schistosoma mansoni TaxID=6183 RepID=UPI00022C86F4|nr:hook homolog, putative [Schistosoma mansoni]|eukprot:XP_018646264.1 hook homolog, putative [Schistosoma mansoni]